MGHAWSKGEVFTGFWLGGPKVRDLAQDRVQWPAFVNRVMNLLVPYRKQGTFLTS